jgi:hypothetical protein
MNEWFTTEQANTYGGLIGGLVGGIGIAGTGTLMGILAPKGIGKRVVVGLQVTWVVVGIASFVLGVLAWWIGQPSHVSYPLVLIGAVSASVMGGLLPVTIHRYRDADRRRLSAAEFRKNTSL